MDILIHWGVRRTLLADIGARGWVLMIAIALDVGVLGTFTFMKLQSDPWIVAIAVIGIAVVFTFVHVFERLESELAKARDRDAGETDVQRRARALLLQTAKPRTSFATCSSDAPLP